MPQPKPIRILYIEDDRDLAALVRFRLGRAGYAVDVAHDGGEGLAKWNDHSYDLVAVDHSMPVHDGLELIGILASRGPLPPTIMITGSGDEKIAVETIKRGADDYVVKDASGGWLDLLPGVIERVMAQRRLKQEKDRIEYQLRQSETRRAEAEKLAAVSRTVARVAHEITNPLAGIRSAFQLVKGAVPPDHPDLKFAEVIEKEIDRISRLVSRMYELYPTSQPPPVGICLGEVLGDVVTMVKPLALAGDIRLENGVGCVDTIVQIPEDPLRQVFYNLLINAVEASPPGAIVQVDANVVEETVEITVSDQGAGIPSGIRDRIFEPFFTTKSGEATGGLGLGLSISQGIVEALHGSLEFESEPERGAVFRITLPLNVS